MKTEPTRYAVIGIGPAPQGEVCIALRAVGEQLAWRGWILRTRGTAGVAGEVLHGASTAKGWCERYEPHPGGAVPAHVMYCGTGGRAAATTARDAHPQWERLRRSARIAHRAWAALLAGDVDRDPDDPPARVLVGWSADGRAPRPGHYGADQVVRLARRLGIPWVDLHGLTRTSEAVAEVSRAVHPSGRRRR